MQHIAAYISHKAASDNSVISFCILSLNQSVLNLRYILSPFQNMDNMHNNSTCHKQLKINVVSCI